VCQYIREYVHAYVCVKLERCSAAHAAAAAAAADAHCPTTCVHFTYTGVSTGVRINTHTHTERERETYCYEFTPLRTTYTQAFIQIHTSIHPNTHQHSSKYTPAFIQIHTSIHPNTHILTPKDSGAREVIKEVSKETYCVQRDLLLTHRKIAARER
jgi:hypothetical protein